MAQFNKRTTKNLQQVDYDKILEQSSNNTDKKYLQ